MKRNRKLLAVAAVIVICLVAARLGISVTEKNKTYEFEQWISTPEYRTDAARAIDAYERLMERYMDLSEAHLMDCQGIAEKLDSIDAGMKDFAARLARIERAMGIDPNGSQVPSKTKDKS